MKKFFLPLMVAFLSVVAVSCYQDERDASQRSQDSLQSIIDAKDGEISALFEMLNQIEDNLASISAKYSTVQELRHNNMESNATVKGEINEQFANLESGNDESSFSAKGNRDKKKENHSGRNNRNRNQFRDGRNHADGENKGKGDNRNDVSNRNRGENRAENENRNRNNNRGENGGQGENAGDGARNNRPRHHRHNRGKSGGNGNSEQSS